MRVLVAYASADGSTAQIAEHIAERLQAAGYEAVALAVGEVGDLATFDAVVVGSAVHAREWLDEATLFVNTHRASLSEKPFYTFSVGMPDALPGFFRRAARSEETDIIIMDLADLEPRDHRLFSGVVKPSQFSRGTRFFLRLAGGRYGDFRDWAAIDGFADEIAEQLRPGDLKSEAGDAPPASPS